MPLWYLLLFINIIVITVCDNHHDLKLISDK